MVNLTLILLGIVFLGLLVFFTILIQRGFQNSLDSIEIKSAGIVAYYQQNVRSALSGHWQGLHLYSVLHLACMHAVLPVFGLGLLYRTDLNFLPIVGGLLLSMQIHQRIYPAE